MTYLFFSFLVLSGIQDLILVFLQISQLATASNLVMFSLAVLLTFLQILDRSLLLLQCYIAKLGGKITNQLSHSQNLAPLGLFFNH